jgi:DNA-binding NtrC family response regulator
VDDEEICRDLAGEILRRAGYLVTVAADGAEALSHLEHTPPDVLVSDLIMPGCSGMDLLQSARERYPDLEVVICTGHGDVATAVRAIRMGAFDYLTKPFEAERLVHTVSQAMGHRRLLLNDGPATATRDPYRVQHAGRNGSGDRPCANTSAPSRPTMPVS